MYIIRNNNNGKKHMEKQNATVAIAAVATAFIAMVAASCSDAIDNTFSKNKSDMQLMPSADYVRLDESDPDGTALTLEWTPAHDFGGDFITTYQYQVQLNGSPASALSEYEDDGVFRRSYTNKELQDMLVSHFGQPTSTVGRMTFTVTASFDGPTLIVPDIATAGVMVKTYGPRQFRADSLFMAGSAVGGRMAMERSEADTLVYAFTGALKAGTINFPLVNFDERNAIGPVDDNAAITRGEMEAVVTDEAEAKSWVVPADGTYRVSVNLGTHKVRIVEDGAVVEADRIFMAGSAVGVGQVQMEPAAENAAVYAWRGELSEGTLYLPLEFEGGQAVAIVPAEGHGINDGRATPFAQAPAKAVASRHWVIPAKGTYRIVADTGEKTIAIYSEATDIKPKVVKWNNTTLKVNPYTTVVDTLYMYGTFNGFAHDPGVFTGYEQKYNLKQSLANPFVFVYSGSELPRSTAKDERGNDVEASVKFTVDNMNNNVYAYGSTASAKRNDHNGYVKAGLGQKLEMVPGQGDNRYAYFVIPEGCNYIEVDIDKLTVVFDKK